MVLTVHGNFTLENLVHLYSPWWEWLLGGDYLFTVSDPGGELVLVWKAQWHHSWSPNIDYLLVWHPTSSPPLCGIPGHPRPLSIFKTFIKQDSSAWHIKCMQVQQVQLPKKAIMFLLACHPHFKDRNASSLTLRFCYVDVGGSRSWKPWVETGVISNQY